MMIRVFARYFLPLASFVLVAQAGAQTPAPAVPAAHLDEAADRTKTPAQPVAPIAGQRLFGTLAVSTKSDEARRLVEKAIDQYENYLLDMSVGTAHLATQKDPHFALAYAVWSFAGRRDQPSQEALRRAQELASTGTPDEQLLVRWMTSVQQADMLPAISAMNDLVSRHPDDKHILYLASEWLYGQQDYARAREMQEHILQIDPNFPPVLNMLGYSSLVTGTPDPAKAVAYLEKYASLQLHQPNPQDSLGEVLRFAGDDEGSIKHYSAALKIIPNFISSQIGLGDTYTLMSNYSAARAQYDRAAPMATNPRDRLHAAYQKALVYFWESHEKEGFNSLDALLAEAAKQKTPYAQFEISFGRAQLSTGAEDGLNQFYALESLFQKPVRDMAESDRNANLAAILVEETRVASHAGKLDAAQKSIAKLEQLATTTRDLGISNNYETARGYLFFAQGDFASAISELSTDQRSPLVVQQIVAANEKLGDKAAADAARLRLKYLRQPTVEWYLVTHSSSNSN